jgi:hypothetical protein
LQEPRALTRIVIIGAIGAGLHLNIPGRIEISGNKNA